VVTTYDGVCRCRFLILSPTPRASSAWKAFLQVVNANPDARSDGDDSRTRLLTPFLRRAGNRQVTSQIEIAAEHGDRT
jgi:hypothetical protein